MIDGEDTPDFYELLQISPNADPETVHRVYRLLAQRFHPDNQSTGDTAQFRLLHDAYLILSDPEKRAQYDIVHQRTRQTRWKVVSADPRTDNDIDFEQLTRLTVLEVLYTHRRTEPNSQGIFVLDLEGLIGRPREHLEFTIWYLLQKRYVTRGDNSKLSITADGVDYLERHYHETLQRKRLNPSTVA